MYMRVRVVHIIGLWFSLFFPGKTEYKYFEATVTLEREVIATEQPGANRLAMLYRVGCLVTVCSLRLI